MVKIEEHWGNVIRELLDRDWVSQSELRVALDVNKGVCSRILWGETKKKQSIRGLLIEKREVILSDYVPRLRGKKHRGHVVRLKRDIDTVKEIQKRFPEHWKDIAGCKIITDNAFNLIDHFLKKIEYLEYPPLDDVDRLELVVALAAPTSKIRRVGKKKFYQHPRGMLDFILQEEYPSADTILKNRRKWRDFFQLTQKNFFEQDRIMRTKKGIIIENPKTMILTAPLASIYNVRWISTVIEYTKKSRITLSYNDFVNRGIPIGDIFFDGLRGCLCNKKILRSKDKEDEELKKIIDYIEITEDLQYHLKMIDVFLKNNKINFTKLRKTWEGKEKEDEEFYKEIEIEKFIDAFESSGVLEELRKAKWKQKN